MKILFLDQTGSLGGAELCLLDTAEYYRDECLVALFDSGPFADRLKQKNIPVQILQQLPLQMRKQGSLWQAVRQVNRLLPLMRQVIQLSQQYELIYANTPKALVVGALASRWSRVPLVYHLHDIISADHFSWINRTLLIRLANMTVKRVIANSAASQAAFILAGGKANITHVIYNGFQVDRYRINPIQAPALRQQLQVDDQFVIGHFSRLSPWKGQHVLLEALADCPENVVVLLVGGALFGEDEYVQTLQQQVERQGLHDRVKFLGFREDIPDLMAACDLITHTSVAPEPFGRVIIEAMLCKTPIVATAAGGAAELIVHGETGWLTPPGDAQALAATIRHCQRAPLLSAQVTMRAYQYVKQNFPLATIQAQTDALLSAAISDRG